MTVRLAGPSMLALISDFTGPTLWRCLQPFTALERAGYPCGWDNVHNNAARLLIPTFDGLLIARSGWQRFARRLVEGFLLEAHDAGRFVVMDLDDDVLSPGFSERQIVLGWGEGKTYEQLEAERAERIWAVRQVDGVTVSTEPLAVVVRSVTDRTVIVVPNAIDAPWFRGALRRRKRQIQAPTIGWAGGMRPDSDVAAMADGWRLVAARHPAVRFVVQGYLPPIVKASVPAERLVVIPWLPLERYPEPLIEVDIACCSVAPDRFNACKSVIKAYEAALAGSAVVASPYLYGDVVPEGCDVRAPQGLIVDGVNGLLAETPAEWAAALDVLLRRPADRSILARRLLKRVEQRHTLARNLAAWPSAWAAIRDDARARHRRLVAV